MSSRPSELEIRAPRNTDETHFAHDLMAKAHGSYYQSLRRVQALTGYPNHRPEFLRLAFWNAELAGALRVTSDTIRIGEARLHMGGLGWVSTAEAHRHKGIARELIADTMHFLRARNYHVAMLFGIPNFYHRFGFTTTLGQYATEVQTVAAVTAPAGDVRIRQIKPGDIPILQRLHNAADASASCSLIRIAPHITLRWEQWRDARVLCDPKGKVLAYFCPRRTADGLMIDEAGLADRALCGPLLHACAQLATEEFAERIRFHAPPEHPLIQFLHQYRSRHETQIVRDEGGMMAFLNLGETLESMLPEWEQQVQNSAIRALRVETTLVIGRTPFRIRANKGALDIATAVGPNKCGLSEEELMQLLTGHRYLEDVLAQRRRILSPEARLLLAALFPKRSPYVWLLDRF